MSRIIERIENLDEHNHNVESNELPDGLRVLEKVEGGGNSMFISLYIALENIEKDGKELPENHIELRKEIIEHLLNNSDKFKMNLNKHRRKEIKAMKYDGVLPCDQCLLAACDLYNVEIIVHYGIPTPIVYKVNNTNANSQVVHLQCISGIHFNPVICIKNKSKQKYDEKNINILEVDQNIEQKEEVVDIVEEIQEI